jgi:peptide deformylase
MEPISSPLKIVHYPHPSLRHPAVPLKFVDAGVSKLAEAMLDLMCEHKGLGLAAPQVGMPYQMFVAYHATHPENPELAGVYINPVVLEKRGGTVEAEEGCLSFPDLYRKVRRARTVVVQAFNLKGEMVEKELHDLPARIWQHETDHLHGVLFIDKLSAIGKMTVRTTLAEFERLHRKAQTRGELPSDVEIERQLKELEKLA